MSDQTALVNPKRNEPHTALQRLIYLNKHSQLLPLLFFAATLATAAPIITRGEQNHYGRTLPPTRLQVPLCDLFRAGEADRVVSRAARLGSYHCDPRLTAFLGLRVERRAAAPLSMTIERSSRTATMEIIVTDLDRPHTVKLEGQL